MKKKLALVLLPVLILSGCASLPIPTEYKSPCACDYERINIPVDPDEPEKAIA